MGRKPTPGRRDALLRAGERVLAVRGIEKTTVTQIVREAGVAQGTFYLYFQSKGELVAAVRRRFAARLAEAVSAQLAAGGPPDWSGRLRDLLEAAADAYLESAALHEVVLHDYAAGEAGPEREWHEEVVGRLAELIDAGRGAGALEATDPEATALLLFCGIDGLFHHALHQPAGWPRERVVAAAWQLVTRTLSKAGPAAGPEPRGVRDRAVREPRDDA